MKRSQPRKPVTRWFLVRSFVRCAMGDHGIGRGAQAYFHPASRLSICAPCMKQHYQLEPPPRAVVFRGDAPVDVRARQAGSDD